MQEADGGRICEGQLPTLPPVATMHTAMSCRLGRNATSLAERLQHIVQLLISMTRGQAKVMVVTGIPRCYLVNDEGVNRTIGR